MYDSVALSGVYDAMALGNHDFDFGPEVTARFIEGFEPQIPFLSANIDVSDEPALAALAEHDLVAPSTVIESGGERIGVMGAVTPRLPNISSIPAGGVSVGTTWDIAPFNNVLVTTPGRRSSKPTKAARSRTAVP